MEEWIRMARLLSRIYPINRWCKEKIVQYFYGYHVLEIIKDSNKKFRISDCFGLMRAYNEAPFRGLVKELMRVNDIYPSPKDIAVAINIAIGGYCSEGFTNNDEIIDFSFHFLTEIENRITTDEILREHFSGINKDVEKLVTNYDRDSLSRILAKKRDIFLNYFRTFEDKRYGQSIRVWHQADDNSWIDWSKENSLEIQMNTRKIREGFFLMGFDYSMNKTGDRLSIATRIDGYEYFNDSENRDHAVWVR